MGICEYYHSPVTVVNENRDWYEIIMLGRGFVQK